MEPTLKELRAKAKDLRAKVSSAPISKASAEQLKAEITFFERAAKAEAAREQRMANLQKIRESKSVKKTDEEPAEKKKSTKKLIKKEQNMESEQTQVVPTQKAKPKMKKQIEFYED
jgi:hypothetical protein